MAGGKGWKQGRLAAAAVATKRKKKQQQHVARILTTKASGSKESKFRHNLLNFILFYFVP